MKKLLSIAVTAAFAAASISAFAQKDVATKSGGEVTDKSGQAVTTKPVKERQKQGPMPKMPKMPKQAEAPKKEPVQKSNVMTKDGKPVTTKSGGDVSSKK
jgi:hypothetical protein